MSSVFCFIHEAFAGRGGIAKFNRDLITGLSDYNGVDNIRVLARDPREQDVPGLQKIKVINSRLGYWWSYLLCLLFPGRVNLIMCAHVNFLPLAYLLRLRTGAPVCLVIHGVDAWEPINRPLVFTALKNVQYVIGVSKFSLDRFFGWAPMAADAGMVLNNCADFEVFSPGPKRQDLVDSLGLAGKRLVLTVGRQSVNERYKGTDELLEVFGEMPDDVVLVVAGDGDDLQRLKDKAERLGVAERIRFPGYISEADKINLYRMADVMSLVGRGEGFGIVLLEAMGCGATVIASKRDASAEVVLDGKFGFVADPDDLENLKETLERALSGDHHFDQGFRDMYSETAFRSTFHRHLDRIFGS